MWVAVAGWTPVGGTEGTLTANLTIRLLLLATTILALVGLLDASIGREWDLVVVFSLILAVQLALWVRLSWGRTSVAVRRDLVHWLRERAARK